MGKMKDLYTEGVTDLESYHLGIKAERERINKVIKEEGSSVFFLWYLLLIINEETNE